jgi:hypothetical protein
MFHMMRRCGRLVVGTPSTPGLTTFTTVVAATPAASVAVSASCWAPGCLSAVIGGTSAAVKAPVSSAVAVAVAAPSTTVVAEPGV